MDSSQVALLCIVTLITFNTIRSVSGKFVPLYLARNVAGGEEWMELIYEVDEGAKPGEYVVKSTGRDILAACPLLEGPDLYKIEKLETGKISIPVEEICANPVESRIHNSENIAGAKSIGFAVLPKLPEEQPVEKDKSIEDDSKSADILPEHLMGDTDEEDSDEAHPPTQKVIKTSSELDDEPVEDLSDQIQKTPEEENDKYNETNLPQNTKYENVELMVFKFDEKIKRIVYTWHHIAPGKLLKAEITRTGKEIYEKNERIYGFDVDDILYDQPGAPFYKVQLAPAEDFFFESWKAATRQNILTAPLWVGLQPQWENLEIFTRRVTQIIDYIEVKTGVSGTLRGRPGLYKVPEYFWKTLFIDFVYGYKQYRQGILFVLPNIIDSQEFYDKNEICPDDEETVSKTGWTRLVGAKGITSMQVCLSNAKNMQSLVEGPYDDYEPLNLKAVPVRRFNDQGVASLETINVLDKLKKSGFLKVNSFGSEISDEE